MTDDSIYSQSLSEALDRPGLLLSVLEHEALVERRPGPGWQTEWVWVGETPDGD